MVIVPLCFAFNCQFHSYLIQLHQQSSTQHWNPKDAFVSVACLVDIMVDFNREVNCTRPFYYFLRNILNNNKIHVTNY